MPLRCCDLHKLHFFPDFRAALLCDGNFGENFLERQIGKSRSPHPRLIKDQYNIIQFEPRAEPELISRVSVGTWNRGTLFWSHSCGRKIIYQIFRQNRKLQLLNLVRTQYTSFSDILGKLDDNLRRQLGPTTTYIHTTIFAEYEIGFDSIKHCRHTLICTYLVEMYQ